MTFEDAFAVASRVRDGLRDTDEIDTVELRNYVIHQHLTEADADVARRYEEQRDVPAVLVHLSDGQSTPYSRGRHRMSLEACGLSLDDAAEVAAEIYRQLIERGVAEISIPQMKRLTYAHLTEHLGDDAARRYLVWEEFRHSDRPLLVLIGGTTGTGKSTLATRVAHQLDIVRTQSTDMLREVMRTMIPPRVTPALHCSSFTAWETLPAPVDGDQPQLVSGYLVQAELVAVAGEAVIGRALRERVSMIVEGVHLHPASMPGIAGDTDAIVVRAVVAVLRPPELKRRIRGRGKVAPDRRAKRYLQHFDEIWDVQSYLLDVADAEGTMIVINDDVDVASREIVSLVMDELLTAFNGTPEEVFG